jgi:hypothetical protein
MSPSGLPVAKRIAYYESAKSYNQRSIKIWNELRARGAQRSSDSNTADKIAKSIADYEAAIEKLKNDVRP